MKLAEYIEKGIDEGIISFEEVERAENEMRYCKTEELEAYCSELREEIDMKDEEIAVLRWKVNKLRRQISNKKTHRKIKDRVAAVFKGM